MASYHMISSVSNASHSVLMQYALGATFPLGPQPQALLAAAPSPGLIDLTYTSIAIGSCLVLVALAISIALHLDLEVKLLVAGIRCVLQLGVLGYILVPIFSNNTWYVVTAYALFMLMVATSEAAGRPAYTYKGLFFTTLISLGTASSFSLCYALLLMLRVHPWWEAQYFIPLLGMILGNTVSGVSVGLTTVLEELSAGRDKVEILLALGATRMEAARNVLQRSMMVALTPLLNQLSVVGIVSIPGMMTGQILGGSDPSQAARYQMMIMFLVTATSSIGSMIAVVGTLMTVIDGCHRLRPDRLTARSNKGGLISGAINLVFQKVVEACTWVVKVLAKGVLFVATCGRGGSPDTPSQTHPTLTPGPGRHDDGSTMQQPLLNATTSNKP